MQIGFLLLLPTLPLLSITALWYASTTSTSSLSSSSSLFPSPSLLFTNAEMRLKDRVSDEENELRQTAYNLEAEEDVEEDVEEEEEEDLEGAEASVEEMLEAEEADVAEMDTEKEEVDTEEEEVDSELDEEEEEEEEEEGEEWKEMKAEILEAKEGAKEKQSNNGPFGGGSESTFTISDTKEPAPKTSDESGENVGACSRANTKFLNNASPRPRVVLLSFPRSGNSMTRLLIERLTGIWTGANNIDPRLQASGFKGEGYMDDTVSVIKTHRLDHIEKFAGKRIRIDKIIYLYRNPFDVFLSRINFVASDSHNEDGQYSAADFRKKVEGWTAAWKQMVGAFVLNLTNHSMYFWRHEHRYIPVLPISYLELLESSPSLHFHLSRIADFLELPQHTHPQTPPLNEVLSRTLTTHSKEGNFQHRSAQDFIDVPPLITPERIQCVSRPELKAGYTPRKKEKTYAIDEFPVELQEYVIAELRQELCALGFIHLRPNLTVECDQKAPSTEILFKR